MRCACVDIGSNTTRLLVGDVVGALPREILAQKVHTHLGRALRTGVADAGRIAADVAQMVSLARDVGAARVRVVATAAVREAGGAPELRAAVRDAAGIPVEVLDPREEAALAFAGATATAPTPCGEESVAVVDVGGGSTEIAVGTVAGGVTWSASVPLGSGRLADEHLDTDPPRASELEQVRAAALRGLAGLRPPPATRALAVGGSAASLTRIAGDRLDTTRVAVAVATLTGAPAHEVAARTGLEPDRVRLLPAGLLLLAAAADLLGRPLELGCGGLREGVVLALAVDNQ